MGGGSGLWDHRIATNRAMSVTCSDMSISADSGLAILADGVVMHPPSALNCAVPNRFQEENHESHRGKADGGGARRPGSLVHGRAGG